MIYLPERLNREEVHHLHFGTRSGAVNNYYMFMHTPMGLYIMTQCPSNWKIIMIRDDPW